jgi:hemolysin III
VLQVVDHCAIYLLIAGTYTPFTLVPLRGPWGWSLFGVVWGLAALGITSKVFFFGRFPMLSVASYLVMGWLGVIAAGPLLSTLSPAALGWLAAGGVAYSGGVWFFVRDHQPWHHLLWHVAVLVGAACHAVAVFTLL